MRVGRALLACLAGLALLPGPALAHAEKAVLDPQEGSRVERAPAEVTISFTEPPTTDARVVVVDGCGNQVQTAVAVSNREAVATIAAGAQPGRWRVAWDVISAVDGHATKGQARFTVAGEPDCSAQSPAPAQTQPEPDQTRAAPAPPAGDEGGFPLVPLALGGAGIVAVALLLRLSGGR